MDASPVYAPGQLTVSTAAVSSSPAAPSTLTSRYEYVSTRVVVDPATGAATATPTREAYVITTDLAPPARVGLLVVGLGGNNGTTLAASLEAHRANGGEGLRWRDRRGEHRPDYLGSLTQASSVRLGSSAEDGRDVFVPFKRLLPMVEPTSLVVGGWDLSAMPMEQAVERAAVLDFDLQRAVRPLLAQSMGVPLPSIYYPSFIAANQADRATNLLPEGSDETKKQQHLDAIRAQIRAFKAGGAGTVGGASDGKPLDKVIVLWSANTERFCDESEALNGTADALLASIARSEAEVSPSTIFAVASILEGCTYINGSPQNTFVPGVVDLAVRHKVAIAGDDFKSGQTKIKSVLVDFLVSAGIAPRAVVSYNHLGNNDGKNLSAPSQFRSKEISKAGVVEDMVASNPSLWWPGGAQPGAAVGGGGGAPGAGVRPPGGGAASPSAAGSQAAAAAPAPTIGPDHVVVIKYVPTVGDSKRALDEYTAGIFMGGTNTIVLHNTCEDSLLATPLMIDLVVLAELFERVKIRRADQPEGSEQNLHPVLSLLGYFLKAPRSPPGAPVVNALFAQREALVNTLRAARGLPAESYMSLETRLLEQPFLAAAASQGRQAKTAM